MGENILSGVISGIISGVFLILFEHLLITKDTSIGEKNVSSRVVEYGREGGKERVIYINTTRNSEDNATFTIVIGCILSIVAVCKYIEYYNWIHFIIITLSIGVGIMAMGMAIFCVRKRMKFKRDLNIMLIFNMLALVSVPVLIWRTVNASIDNGIDMEKLRLQMVETGKIPIFEDMSVTMFLLYQVLGLATILIYMLAVFISNIYLISLINLNLNSKLRKMWEFLNRKTYAVASNSVCISLFELVFLVFSYFMVSGILLNWIDTQTIR